MSDIPSHDNETGFDPMRPFKRSKQKNGFARNNDDDSDVDIGEPNVEDEKSSFYKLIKTAATTKKPAEQTKSTVIDSNMNKTIS